MPRKIRDLMGDLVRAEFVKRGGKGIATYPSDRRQDHVAWWAGKRGETVLGERRGASSRVAAEKAITRTEVKSSLRGIPSSLNGARQTAASSAAAPWLRRWRAYGGEEADVYREFLRRDRLAREQAPPSRPPAGYAAPDAQSSRPFGNRLHFTLGDRGARRPRRASNPRLTLLSPATIQPLSQNEELSRIGPTQLGPSGAREGVGH